MYMVLPTAHTVHQVCIKIKNIAQLTRSGNSLKQLSETMIICILNKQFLGNKTHWSFKYCVQIEI